MIKNIKELDVAVKSLLANEWIQLITAQWIYIIELFYGKIVYYHSDQKWKIDKKEAQRND